MNQDAALSNSFLPVEESFIALVDRLLEKHLATDIREYLFGYAEDSKRDRHGKREVPL